MREKSEMTLREAAQYALKELEYFAECGWESDAITDLRAALAEPTSQESRQVELVGYFSINSYGNWEQNKSGYGTPFYSAPPKREPMTEQQLDEMFDQAEIAIYIADRQQKEHLEVYSFGVRDAEKWHGIGDEE